jgi:hypothetical protein
VLEGRNYIGIEKNEEQLFRKERIDLVSICEKRLDEAKNTVKSDRTLSFFGINTVE